MVAKKKARWMMAVAALGWWQAAMAGGEGAEGSSCESWLPAVRVEGSEEQRRLACEGLARAASFLKAHGFEPKLGGEPIKYVFVKNLTLPCSESDCKGIRVAGVFDEKANQVTMNDEDDALQESQGQSYFFNLPYSRELYVSVLAHESTHALNKEFYRYKPNTRAQDEYIAYASQLWSMDEKLRKVVLASYEEGRYSFGDEGAINDLIHAFEPNGFGVRSYRHFTGSRGGRAMMERIYSGDFKPPLLD